MLENILLGFATALSLQNLLYAFVGVLIGNAIGVLPGIGALAAISMLLPITYGLDPTGALMMLAGLYYGTSYGGAITSILLNVPGTVTHAVVCVDGNPMARQGRAGPALFVAMAGSFLGASCGIVILMLFSPLLAEAAFAFGPAEYFALMLLGLLAASTLAVGSPLKGVSMVLVGMIAGVVGIDVNSGAARFTFDVPELMDGLSLVALALGLFGVADVYANANRLGRRSFVTETRVTARTVRPEKGEMRRVLPAIGRGAGLGSFFGALPGTGGTLASFVSYGLEKRVSRTPERFGRGAPEGVAGPESANSSATITAFIPTLTLGIPGDAVMALMLGAMMIHNIIPGPQLMAQHPTVFWGLVGTFWIASALLLILNLPLIGMWVKMLSIPYRLLYPAVLLFICIGVYGETNSLFNVGVVLAVGLFGSLINRLGFEPAPALLGFILGPMMEENFRRALLLAHGDLTVFLTRPISGACMLVTFAMVALVTYKRLRRWPLARPGEPVRAVASSTQPPPAA